MHSGNVIHRDQKVRSQYTTCSPYSDIVCLFTCIDNLSVVYLSVVYLLYTYQSYTYQLCDNLSVYVICFQGTLQILKLKKVMSSGVCKVVVLAVCLISLHCLHCLHCSLPIFCWTESVLSKFVTLVWQDHCLRSQWMRKEIRT